MFGWLTAFFTFADLSNMDCCLYCCNSVRQSLGYPQKVRFALLVYTAPEGASQNCKAFNLLVHKKEFIFWIPSQIQNDKYVLIKKVNTTHLTWKHGPTLILFSGVPLVPTWPHGHVHRLGGFKYPSLCKLGDQ